MSLFFLLSSRDMCRRARSGMPVDACACSACSRAHGVRSKIEVDRRLVNCSRTTTRGVSLERPTAGRCHTVLAEGPLRSREQPGSERTRRLLARRLAFLRALGSFSATCVARLRVSDDVETWGEVGKLGDVTGAVSASWICSSDQLRPVPNVPRWNHSLPEPGWLVPAEALLAC